MVHQVGLAGDRLRLERQALEQLGLGPRRRRHGDRAAVIVGVVDEPDPHAALVRGDERRGDDLARLAGAARMS